MDDQLRLETHECLASIVLDKIISAYLTARDRGVEDPAVLVLDLRDADAYSIGMALISEAEVEAVIAEAVRRGKAPILTAGIERASMLELLSAHSAIDVVSSGVNDSDPTVGYLLGLVAAGAPR